MYDVSIGCAHSYCNAKIVSYNLHTPDPSPSYQKMVDRQDRPSSDAKQFAPYTFVEVSGNIRVFIRFIWKHTQHMASMLSRRHICFHTKCPQWDIWREHCGSFHMCLMSYVSVSSTTHAKGTGDQNDPYSWNSQKFAHFTAIGRISKLPKTASISITPTPVGSLDWQMSRQ